MVGGEAMIVAGIGCRRGCPAADIVALVRQVGGADALAAPSWKRDEPGLREAARTLGLPLRFVDAAALAAVQSRCPTRSAVVARATGFASVAEAAALAGGGVLRQPRVGVGWATLALVETGVPPFRHVASISPSGRGPG
jgi:cobalt-precorrin 5A hydrolase